MSETKTKARTSITAALTKTMTLQQRINDAVEKAKRVQDFLAKHPAESKAPEAEPQKPIVKANAELRRHIGEYKEYTATEKLAKERRERERDFIISAAGKKECILIDDANDMQLGIVINGKRSSLDAERLLGDFPELAPLFAAYRKETDGWQFRAS